VSNGDPDKPLLLFVHGFFEFWYSWRYQLKYFSTDYRVMAIDIKGYGESDKPAGKENYNFDVFEQDFVELVKAVSSNKKCTLIAHDGGGILCWRVAEHHPELFHKCILTNVPHPRAYKRLLSKSWKQLFASWYAFMFQFPWLPELLFSINDYEVLHLLQKRLENFSEEDLEAYKYTYSRKGALSPMFDYYRSMFTKGSKKPFKTVEIPTLCLWTENHSAFDMSIVHGYDDICTDLTIKMIPDSSSFLQQYCPDVVNNYIKEFLQQ
jgi:pimeloyl-ACP methyl ester carboxylesterase